MDKKIAVAAAAIILAVAGYALFGTHGGTNSIDNNTGKQTVKQAVRVSGAWALYPLMVKWAEEYKKVNPDVEVSVDAGGAGKGMADALSGLVEIGMISRDIDPAEIQKGAYPLKVAKDAVIPTFNRNNPLADEILKKGVRMSQFTDIFISGNLTDWSEVAGKAGASGRISVFTRSDSCGAGDVWSKYLGGKQEDLKGIGVNGDPGIADAVSQDKLGMGYNNLNFAYDDKTGKPAGNLMMVPIDINGDGIIGENESFYFTKQDMMEAIADGRYPAPPARDLYIVTKNKPAGPTQGFIRWIMADGQQYVTPAGYIPLSGDVLAQENQKL